MEPIESGDPLAPEREPAIVLGAGIDHRARSARAIAA